MTSGVLKSHLSNVNVHNDIQKIAFGYWENWEDCKICDLDSVTSCVLKSHLADVLETKCVLWLHLKEIYLWVYENNQTVRAVQIMQK